MLTLDLWSDVVCPWCWIGKHRLEAAVKSLGLEGQVQLRFHAYELGGREKSGLGVHEHLALKYGISRQEAVEMTDRVEKVGAANKSLSMLISIMSVSINMSSAKSKLAQQIYQHRWHCC